MSQCQKLKPGLGQQLTKYPVGGKRADRVEERGQIPHDMAEKGACMNIKRKFTTILTMGLFSGWLLTFLVVQNAWCMSDSETNRHSALAEEKEGKDLTSPKDFHAPKPPQRFQPREQIQEPPVIAPPTTDPEMVIPPPLMDAEMVVPPESTEPTEEENTQNRPKD